MGERKTSIYREPGQCSAALFAYGLGIMLVGLGTAGYGWGWFVGGGILFVAGSSMLGAELAKPTGSVHQRAVDEVAEREGQAIRRRLN
jgi:hypothetical protein